METLTGYFFLAEARLRLLTDLLLLTGVAADGWGLSARPFFWISSASASRYFRRVREMPRILAVSSRVGKGVVIRNGFRIQQSHLNVAQAVRRGTEAFL